MNSANNAGTVWFTTRGRVVIPLHLRKEFKISKGTRAIVQATPEGILLKPVTIAAIRRTRGILKRKPGKKSLAKDRAEHKKHERGIEETEHCATGT